MKFRIEENIHRRITTGNVVPKRCREMLIPFAKATYTEGPFGSILSQEIKGDYYSIWQHYFFIRQPVTLYPQVEEPLFILNYMKKGNVNCVVPEDARLTVREDTYYLYYAHPLTKYKAIYEVGEFEAFHVDFKSEYLEDMAACYPDLIYFLHKAIGINIQSAQLQYTLKITHAIRNIINQMTDNNESALQRGLFYSCRISELLLLYIKDVAIHLHSDHKLEGINLGGANEFIVTHLREKMDIVSLAKQFHTNPSTLKKEFKKHFGQPIHHYIIIQRLKKAGELLLKNVPVHMIAHQVGYNDLPSFTRAFILFYHQTPTAYKRENKRLTAGK